MFVRYGGVTWAPLLPTRTIASHRPSWNQAWCRRYKNTRLIASCCAVAGFAQDNRAAPELATYLHDFPVTPANLPHPVLCSPPTPDVDATAPGTYPDPQVFPFVHTFPAHDESRRTWIESTCRSCPATSELLRRVPNIRTALFSRLGGGSRISGHRGWADLANHVLRCHLPLKVPSDGPCGLWVNEEVCVWLCWCEASLRSQVYDVQLCARCVVFDEWRSARARLFWLCFF